MGSHQRHMSANKHVGRLPLLGQTGFAAEGECVLGGSVFVCVCAWTTQMQRLLFRAYPDDK